MKCKICLKCVYICGTNNKQIMTQPEVELFLIHLNKSLDKKARHCFAFGESGARNEYKYRITAYILERALRGETKIVQRVIDRLLQD